jgi:hypothetical protein
MTTADQELIHSILREVDVLLKRGSLPVHNTNLEHLCGGNILEYLIFMKKQGLISGNLITIGARSIPHRMTNIRLTYAGIRALQI